MSFFSSKILLLWLSLIVIGCTTAVPREEDVDMITGKIIYVELEGGFYGIDAGESKKFFPLNLGEAFRQDGLNVCFSYRVVKNVQTTVMWGTPVEILHIEKK